MRLGQSGVRFKNKLCIFLSDANSVVKYLDVQLARSGVKSAADIDFGVVVRKLQRIVNQVADDLLDTQLVLDQFLWDIV